MAYYGQCSDPVSKASKVSKVSKVSKWDVSENGVWPVSLIKK